MMLNDIYSEQKRLLALIETLKKEVEDYKTRLAKIAALVHPR
jgi:hypothetical protein